MPKSDDERKIPEPFQVIISPMLFQAIKFNQTLRPSEKYLSDEDLEDFETFKTLFKDFLARLNKHDQGAFSILSNIMSMWGYSRKYCGMCGRPVLGKGQHIQNRIVCDTCGNSYRIAEELYRRQDQDEEDGSGRDRGKYKGKNYDPNYNRKKKWNNQTNSHSSTGQNNT